MHLLGTIFSGGLIKRIFGAEGQIMRARSSKDIWVFLWDLLNKNKSRILLDLFYSN